MNNHEEIHENKIVIKIIEVLDGSVDVLPIDQKRVYY